MWIFFCGFFLCGEFVGKTRNLDGNLDYIQKSKAALVAKRFLPHENEIARLNIMRERVGFSPTVNLLPAVSLQVFVNFFVNDKTCLTLYVICKFSLLTKSLSKIFNIFLNKYYPNIA